MAQAYMQARADILTGLSQMGVSVTDTGVSLSDELLDSLRPKPAPAPDPYAASTVTFSNDMSAFRDAPAPAPKVEPEIDFDHPMSRREVVALVQRLQGGQTPPPYSQGQPASLPTFRSEAVLNVLEAQIRDAWRRRGRS